MHKTDTPLEVNDLMATIVAKALRWRVAQQKLDAKMHGTEDEFREIYDAILDLQDAIDAYRKTLDGA